MVYEIEARIRGRDAEERRAVRQTETKPLMEALKARLEAVKDGISRQSTLIKAIDYMLERWAGLTAFLDDGRLEPDTNTCSGAQSKCGGRAIKGRFGRKLGETDGTVRRTLIETGRTLCETDARS